MVLPTYREADGGRLARPLAGARVEVGSPVVRLVCLIGATAAQAAVSRRACSGVARRTPPSPADPPAPSGPGRGAPPGPAPAGGGRAAWARAHAATWCLRISPRVVSRPERASREGPRRLHVRRRLRRVVTGLVLHDPAVRRVPHAERQVIPYLAARSVTYFPGARSRNSLPGCCPRGRRAAVGVIGSAVP